MRVIDFLSVAFPDGTGFGLAEPNDKTVDPLSRVPHHPADLFGICALLLERSGGYHSLMPGCRSFTEKGSPQYSPHAWFVSDAEMTKAQKAGRKWGDWTNSPKAKGPTIDFRILVPKDVQVWWDELWKDAESPLFVYLGENVPAPAWWKPVILMLIAADEASKNIGLFSDKKHAPGKTISDFDLLSKVAEVSDQIDQAGSAGDGKNVIQFRPTYNNLASALSRDVALVHPKTRTSGVGCTLRTLSHNLALMPPQGQLGSYWIRPLSDGFGRTSGQDYGILMIPYPFEIDPNAFSEADPGKVKHMSGRGKDWNWFDVEQNWLPGKTAKKGRESLVDFILAIIEEAQHKSAVHAVVLPEFALDWDIYERICKRIVSDPIFKNLEILVSGASDNCHGERGNYVLSAVFYDGEMLDDDTRERAYIVTSRSKHHRWKIDGDQIRAYGLEDQLDPDKVYWEHIPLPRRELHHFVFREGSIFTSLICEDLARSDPCHRNLRAVGPNLMFVLLMDGAQLASRWPARYSTGMTDDPGTTILTLTSRALVKASNAVRAKANKKPDYSVALFKDDSSAPLSIQCEESNQGVLLSLTVENITEGSFDGRHRKSAQAWRRRKKADIQQIKLPTSDKVDTWLKKHGSG